MSCPTALLTKDEEKRDLKCELDEKYKKNLNFFKKFQTRSR